MTFTLRWLKLLMLLIVLAAGVACGLATHMHHALLERAIAACEPHVIALLSWLQVPVPAHDLLLMCISCAFVVGLFLAAKLVLAAFNRIMPLLNYLSPVRLKYVWLTATLLLLLLLAVAWAGFFDSHEGRDFVVTTVANIRANNLAGTHRYPSALSTLLALLVELPLFIVCKGDRKCLFRLMHHELGPVFPYQQGIAIATHHGVKAVMTSLNQPRGHYIGALVAPDACMLPDTLIFMPTGSEHARLRKLLLQAIPAFTTPYSLPATPPLSSSSRQYTRATQDDVRRYTTTQIAIIIAINLTAILRHVLSLLYQRMFEAQPHDHLLDVLMDYFTYGGTCVLGKDLHKLMFGLVEKKILAIRLAAYANISNTPTGRRLRDVALRDGMSTKQQDDMVMQAVDGFLFAGGFGTSHLAYASLNALHACAHAVDGGCAAEGPRERAVMWSNDADAFMHEAARLDPPVTSVTSLLQEDKDVDVYTGTRAVKMRLPANTTVQLFISEANVDPSVFGGASHSEARALQFDITRPSTETDEILSWNAPLSLVQLGRAPRGCIGYSLSLEIARRTVEHFRPVAAAHVQAAVDAAAAEELTRVKATDDGAQVIESITQYDVLFHSMWSANSLMWVLCCLYVSVNVRIMHHPRFMDGCLKWFAEFQIAAYVAMYFDVKGMFLICYMCSGCCCIWVYARVRSVRNVPRDKHPQELHVEYNIRVACCFVAVVTALLVLYIRNRLFDTYSTRSYLRILCTFFIPCVLLCA